MKLYGVARSRATRPLWALIEAGLPFEQVPVIQAGRLADPAAADAPLNTASPAYLAVNPMGQVPALVDGDLVLTESLAMVLHVGRRAGAPLGPADAAEDAQMTNWIVFAAAALDGVTVEIVYVVMEGAQATPEGQARLAAATERLVRPLARIEAHLSGAEWLVGNRFTVADIALAECLRYAQAHAPALEPFPALRAWLARCQARPAFARVMALRAAEPA